MKNLETRLETIADITCYLGEPIFQNKYDLLYIADNDSLAILARDFDCMMLLYMYANINKTPASEEILGLLHVPENQVILLKGSSIETFADSLLEFFLALRFYME